MEKYFFYECVKLYDEIVVTKMKIRELNYPILVIDVDHRYTLIDSEQFGFDRLCYDNFVFNNATIYSTLIFSRFYYRLFIRKSQIEIYTDSSN